LEREAGIPEEVLVEAHGSFASAHCIDCHQEEKIEIIKGNFFILFLLLNFYRSYKI